jgi:hypothetical protein
MRDITKRRPAGAPDNKGQLVQRSPRGTDSQPAAFARHSFTFGDIPLFANPPGGGQPVPDSLRTRFESATGNSVGSARVHTGPLSQQAADALDANAFTIGSDIHFGPGQFQPGTPHGDHLLAHELTHTVQQQFGPAVQRQSDTETEDDGAAESEADDVADAVLDEDAEQAPTISARPQGMVLRKPKKKSTPKSKPKKSAAPKASPTPKPKPIEFHLFRDKFTATVDAANNVTVTKAGKSDGGWTFTSAGPNVVHAERSPDHAEYVHKGGATDPLVERCTITVAGGKATPSLPIVAELGSPATLSIPLIGAKNAKRKTITVNGVGIEQLDLTGGSISFTPADGDSIHLSLGGDAWVFSSLKQDPAVAPAPQPPDIKGFFRAGYFTRYKDHGKMTYGIATPSLSDADKKKFLDDLTDPSVPAARRVTTDEAERFKTVSLIESDVAGVQTYDSGILSYGIAQWTVNADLPRLLLKLDSVTFERYLGRYGLEVKAPVRQLDKNVHKFAAERKKLGVRNPSEGALFLNRKELVNQHLLDVAAAQQPILSGIETQATTVQSDVAAAEPNLKSKDPVKKADAVKVMDDAKAKIAKFQKQLAGLTGVKTVKGPGPQAALLAGVAKTGAAACADIAANCEASEVLRGEEWALRFEMLGHSPGGQDVEIAEIRANWTDVSSKSASGAGFTTLLPNLRGQSALLSSYLNTHKSTAGVERTVKQFKTKKRKEAEAGAKAAAKAKKPAPSPSPADWDSFPWPTGDARWTSLWTSAAIKEFEDIAVMELTKPTTNPKRRRGIIKKQFP